MAIQPATAPDPASLGNSRYTEQRDPQFIGGNIDANTGNLMPGTHADVANGSRPTPSLTSTPGTDKVASDAALAASVPSTSGLSPLPPPTLSLPDYAGSTPPPPATPTTALGTMSVAPTSAPIAPPPAVPAPTPVDSSSSTNSMIGGVAGAVVGNMILPGIGGILLGGALGSLMCHAAGTMIVMLDGSRKPVEALEIGDQVMLGGAVLGRGEVLAADLFKYKGTVVNGRHAVFEDGRWLRVEDSEAADAVDTGEPVRVYPLVTECHLLVCEQYICADFAETDDADMSASERIAKLNRDTERNGWLAGIGSRRLAA